jgi:hypothetical protein
MIPERSIVARSEWSEIRDNHRRYEADPDFRFAPIQAALVARDRIAIYGLPMMCRWADGVPAHIIYAPVSL